MKINLLFLIGLALCAFSCANKGNIGGGDKDEIPPEILSSVPENRSTNFTAKEVVIDFDENIKLNNLNQQLLISPPFTTNPEIKARAKSLVIEFKEELLENTTYTINFGDALQDLNEGNPIPGYSYVFSTGDVIDSLSYSAKALDARTLTPTKDTWALLHKNLADSAVQTERPYYIAKIKDDGTFQFNNLSEGEYNLFALIDNNFNNIYDLPNEKIGFINETINLPDTSLNPLTINIFEQKTTQVFLRDISELSKGQIQLKGNGTLDTLSLASRDFDWRDWPKYRHPSGDTLTIWRAADITEERLFFTASQETYEYTDTLSLRLKEELIVDSTFKAKPSIGAQFSFGAPISLTHAYPFITWPENIALLEDSLSVAGGVDLIAMDNPSQLLLDFPWAYGKEYEIMIPAGDMRDYYNNVNDTLVFNFKTKKKEDFGGLNLSILNASAEGYIIELLNANGDVRYSAYSNDFEVPIEWLHLLPGTYTIRLVEDANGNRAWDTGDYALKRQPEKIIVFTEPVELRADWTIDLTVDVIQDEG